jgi:hypothetical protein
MISDHETSPPTLRIVKMYMAASAKILQIPVRDGLGKSVLSSSSEGAGCHR